MDDFGKAGGRSLGEVNCPTIGWRFTNEFPGIKGFSVQNLWYMRQFCLEYKGAAIQADQAKMAKKNRPNRKICRALFSKFKACLMVAGINASYIVSIRNCRRLFIKPQQQRDRNHVIVSQIYRQSLSHYIASTWLHRMLYGLPLRPVFPVYRNNYLRRYGSSMTFL